MKRLLCIALCGAMFLLGGCASSVTPHSASAIILGQYSAIRNLDGNDLYMIVASGSGVFAHTTNKDYFVRFDNSGQYHSDDSQLLNAGSFAYKVNSGNNKQARLTYTVLSGDLAGKTLAVSMDFHSANTGTYSLQITHGGSGAQEGIFEIQY